MDADAGAKLGRIGEFYRGRVIFLTGASGFLGKMTLEKLLRSCASVQKIYILLRAKKDKDAGRRMDELFNSIIFEKVQKENPDFKRKITIVEGDCSQPDLGLKPEVKEVLMHEVDIIIHWAATVKFDENLKIATNINVRSVRDLIRMAKHMPQLKCFLHVSTAYSQCVQDTIAEEFYPTPIKGEALINMMNALDLQTVEKLTPILIDKWPNTYVFTKSVTENMISEIGHGLPIGFIRPSMVLGCYKEPVPGWIDNVYGPTGTMIGMAMGFIRVMRTDLRCVAEVVPGDVVVNTAMAAIVDINRKHELNSKKVAEFADVPIYNVVSSSQTPITWQTYKNLTVKHCKQIPSPKIIWHSIQVFTGNPVLYYLAIFFLHLVPAYLFDGIASCIGKKPLMVKAYKKVHHLISTVSFFATRSWRFENTNVQKLWRQVDDDDKKLFDFNLDNFDWDDYFRYYTRGGRVYLLKDPMDTLPQGRRKLKLLKIAHYSLCAVLLFFFYKILCFLL